jgi:hypothetical protein
MCKSHSHIELQYERGVSPRLSWSLPEVLAKLGLPLLFAIRMWASVCLALFIAFQLQAVAPVKTIFASNSSQGPSLGKAEAGAGSVIDPRPRLNLLPEDSAS